jgi:hypothetical protein
MKPGELLAGRFEVSALARSGGMGTILRAHDRLTGEQVAVKILSLAARAGSDRFLHEARTLAEFAHPSIVRYVAHGVTPEGARTSRWSGSKGRTWPTVSSARRSARPKRCRSSRAPPRASPSRTPRSSSTVTSSRATSSWSGATRGA